MTKNAGKGLKVQTERPNANSQKLAEMGVKRSNERLISQKRLSKNLFGMSKSDVKGLGFATILVGAFIMIAKPTAIINFFPTVDVFLVGMALGFLGAMIYASAN